MDGYQVPVVILGLVDIKAQESEEIIWQMNWIIS